MPSLSIVHRHTDFWVHYSAWNGTTVYLSLKSRVIPTRFARLPLNSLLKLCEFLLLVVLALLVPI